MYYENKFIKILDIIEDSKSGIIMHNDIYKKLSLDKSLLNEAIDITKQNDANHNNIVSYCLHVKMLFDEKLINSFNNNTPFIFEFEEAHLLKITINDIPLTMARAGYDFLHNVRQPFNTRASRS